MMAARRIISLAALSAIAVVAAPSAGAQTRTVTSVIGSADGLFVSVDVEFVAPEEVAAQELLTFGPEPSVTLPSTGGSVSDEVLDVDESVGPISLTAAVLTAATEGALGPDGFATAETTVADLALGEPPVEEVGVQQLTDPILAAELISATCAADLAGVSGTTTLVGASVLGETLAVEPEPNTEIEVEVPGVATVGVTLNRQVQNPDGSLSVTALVLDIAVNVVDALSVTGTVEIGPATCGVVEGVEVPAEVVVPAPAQAVPAQARFTG